MAMKKQWVEGSTPSWGADTDHEGEDRSGEDGPDVEKLLRIVVLASGRGSNLQAIIDASARGDIPVRISAVISDQPGAKALERARRAGIAAHALPRSDYPSRRAFFEAIAERVDEAGGELIVLAGFMRILPPWFVRSYPRRIMNIHPSLLPAFPGLDAPRQALEYGVRVSGCTVHFVDEGVDTGPIILQAAVPVYPEDDVARLTARIQEQEHRLYPQALTLYAEGRLWVEGRRVAVADASERAACRNGTTGLGTDAKSLAKEGVTDE